MRCWQNPTGYDTRGWCMIYIFTLALCHALGFLVDMYLRIMPKLITNQVGSVYVKSSNSVQFGTEVRPEL